MLISYKFFINLNLNILTKSNVLILLKLINIHYFVFYWKYFNIINEDLQIFGKNSLFTNNEIIMTSDEEIKINNITGNFLINGPDSRLKSNTIDITGYLIKGKFSQIENISEVELLYVEDEMQINIKTETLDMYALRAKYDRKNNIIELFSNVEIFRDNESISGNYAKINTLTESYKVTSKKSEKVKVLLNKTDE